MSGERKLWHWLAVALLALIWGTSYNLMKKGLESFSTMQIGTMRIFITFLCLLPVAVRKLKKISSDNLRSILITGLLGNAIPAFLFPIAQTRIACSLEGMLNGLQITSLAFFMVGLPTAIYLLFSDFSHAVQTDHWVRNLGFIAILAIMCSATALAIFYPLIRDTSPVFASIVTYFIPLVATLWGIGDSEHLSTAMLYSVVFILCGVYLINSPGITAAKFFSNSKRSKK
jgi:drug/metabolite transporter (DMT)-like permease